MQTSLGVRMLISGTLRPKGSWTVIAIISVTEIFPFTFMCGKVDMFSLNSRMPELPTYYYYGCLYSAIYVHSTLQRMRLEN